MNMSNKLYDILKWVCLIGLPAISTVITAIFPLLNIPYVDETVKLISAIATLLGAWLGVSSVNYYKAYGSIEMPKDEQEVDNTEVGEG